MIRIFEAWNTIFLCSYPFTDELPGMDYTPGRITPKNLWGFSQAQELSGLSKEML